jgi:hypothetical protein
MDVEIPAIIYSLWPRSTSNTQIMSQIKETSGIGVIYLRSVQQRTHDFVAGRTEFDRLPRPGRPIDPGNADRMRELLESEPYISQNTLSRRLNLQHNIVHRILKEELGLSKVNFKSIPHSMRKSHKQKPVRISIELFPFLEKFSRQKLAHPLTQE